MTKRIKKIWTPEERADFIKLYPTADTKELAAKFGTSVRAIYSQAGDLGLNKEQRVWNKGLKGKNFIEAIGEEAYNKMRVAGTGNIPWNKGMKGEEYRTHFSEETYNKMVTTTFIKGSQPPNTIPGTGHIRIRNDKRGVPQKWYKVADGKWIQYSRHVYETEIGPIPKKHVIAFKDRDTLNCEPENLECITMKENMTRNSFHQYPEPMKEIVHLRSQISRKINKLTKPNKHNYAKEQN